VTWRDPHLELAGINRWFEQRGLELDCHERPNGRWRAIVTDPHASKGAAEFADGDDELDAARRAQRRQSTRQLRMALDALSMAAQSEAVQLLAAEILLSRLPGGRARAGRQAALAAGVWMLDPRRRQATVLAGRIARDWTAVRVAGRRREELPRVAERAIPDALAAAERGLERLRRRLEPPAAAS
jgi:hypothetical protein